MMSEGLRVYCSPHSCESLATSVRDTLANRRRARHLAPLKELVDELGRDAVEVVKPTLLPLVANTEAARQPELKADSKRRLPGDELAKIILADTDNILSQSWMFTGHIAYPRVRYNLSVTLHFDGAVCLTK
jgi:hypothetical protein